jgi:hypothetical protein
MIASLLTLFLSASTADPPKADGVWRGTLGKQAIVACLDRGSGDYYYESRRWSIPLWSQEGEAVFQEGSDYNAPTGSWRIGRVEGDSLEAEWRAPDGKRSFPIRLKRIAGPAKEDELCSEGLAYNAPRISKVARGPAKTTTEQGLRVTRESALNLDVERLQLQLPGPAGARIDASLDAEYRQRLGQAYSCMVRGEKGDFNAWIAVEVASPRWIVVDSRVDEFCGGAHPEQFGETLTFDRRDGRRVDTSGWLRLEKNFEPSAALRALLIRKAAPAEECADVWKEPMFSLEAYPTADGVAIDVDFPHVVQACGDTVRLSLKQASPYLTDAARKALAPAR